MSWQDIMRRVLPPAGGALPDITSRFGAVEGRPLGSTNPHRGVDFNYFGKDRINRSHPVVRAPVTGIVTMSGEGGWGTIAIRDANGLSHEILHSRAQHVAVGDPVVAGQIVGTMGNTGLKRKTPEDGTHVHYQLKDPAGNVVDPTAFWDQQGRVDPNPSPPAYLGEHQQYLHSFGEAGSVPASVEAPDDNKNIRRLVRVTPATAAALTDMTTRPVTPPNEIPSDRSASFVDRFGDWVSTPEVSAPRGPDQADPPQQGSRPLGIITGQPMPDWPFPPPIWGIHDEAKLRGIEDWTGSKRRRAKWE